MPSSRRLFDFQCKCGIIFEELVYEYEKTCKCPNCGAEDAPRQISPAHIWWRKMGVSTDFPTASARWTKAQWEKAKQDRGGRQGDGQPNLKEY